MSAELTRHVGHTVALIDPRRLRCHDCAQTVWLPDTPKSTSTSSRSPIPGPGEPRCPTHPTEHASSCRTCAADAKAHPQADSDHGRRQVTHQPTADVTIRAAEARAALPPRRHEPRRTPADPERMAQARAELDAAFPRIQRESETEETTHA